MISRAERFRRVRLGNLKSLFLGRWGYELPDDDAGRGDLLELLIVISLGENASLKMQHAVELWAPWLSRDEAAELLDHVNRTPIQDRKVGAVELGERLRITNAERERLKLWTLWPVDMTEAEMDEQRKAKKRARDHARAAKRRHQYEAEALSRSKPWEAEGISRATWYRRETSPRQQLEAEGWTDFPPTHDVMTLPEPLRSCFSLPSPIDSQPLPRVRQVRVDI